MRIHWQETVHAFAAYPPWLSIPCVAIAGVFLFWLAIKVLKWSIAMIFIGAIVFAGTMAAWLWLK